MQHTDCASHALTPTQANPGRDFRGCADDCAGRGSSADLGEAADCTVSFATDTVLCVAAKCREGVSIANADSETVSLVSPFIMQRALLIVKIRTRETIASDLRKPVVLIAQVRRTFPDALNLIQLVPCVRRQHSVVCICKRDTHWVNLRVYCEGTAIEAERSAYVTVTFARTSRPSNIGCPSIITESHSSQGLSPTSPAYSHRRGTSVS